MEFFGMTLQSWGLLLDGIGFTLIFIFGGASILDSDGTIYKTGDVKMKFQAGSKLIHLPKWGAVMVVVGFALQFVGSL